MPFPKSPFTDGFNTRVITSLKEDDSQTQSEINLEETLRWLCTCPRLTSYRVNTLKADRATVAKHIQDKLDRVLGADIAKAEYSDISPDIILIKHLAIDTLSKYKREVVVDVFCAAAVLRGAHIFAPGVLAMISGVQVGDEVSIYADLSRKCKKGLLKIYVDPMKLFIGNGVVRMARASLFGDKLSPSGIAVEVLKVTSGCPPIGDRFLPPGWALLQNLPSILCVNVLNPQINETILDMCAAPGHKTTHIAALMKNQGLLVAIDKTPNKVEQLIKTCKEFQAQALIFQADSCKILNANQLKLTVEQGPPFAVNTFDKILLDAPCSALGKRPQFSNNATEKVIRSYVPLQRKLFATAFALLKPKGILVYSTCTITLGENEGIVSWALKTFNYLELVKTEICHGGPGWPGTALSDEERGKVQRFGPDQEVDSVGFFIACFVKR